MVRKIKSKDRKGDTRLLYKKSNNTLHTQSKTCSGLSQYYTRSAILLIKNNLSKATEQYTDGNKVKKDFSIETDICILRRYYKNKRLKMSDRGGSAKSKYSSVTDTELNEIKEFEPVLSTCSDSRHAITNNKQPKVDLATIMIHNLKGLLKSWLRKNLVDDKNDNIKTVLDSMHCVDLDAAKETNSQSTFTLNRQQKSYQVKNKKLETTSVMCQYCKQKSRLLVIGTSKTAVYKGFPSHSAPFSKKKIKLASTVSVPRNIHNTKKINSPGIRKIGRKKFALTINKSVKLLSSSSFDLLTISTKSLTKKCATCDLTDLYSKTNTAYCSKLTHKNTVNDLHNASNNKITSQITYTDKLKDMLSLFKSIYADDPANITSTEKYITKTENNNKIEDNSRYTMLNNKVSFPIKLNEQKDSTQPLVNMNFINKACDSPKSCLIECQGNCSTTVNVNKQKAKNRRNKYNKRQQIQRSQNKNLSIRYNKINNKQLQDKSLSKIFQHVIKYFSDYNSNKNIKFDININFTSSQNTADKSIDASNENFCNSLNSNPIKAHVEHIIDMSQNFEENLKENDTNPNDLPVITIIPSLQQASQCKFNSTNFSSMSITTFQNTHKKSLNSSDLELFKEISELKSEIKDLAIAAKNFVDELYIKDEKFIAHTGNPKKPSICSHSSKDVQLVSNIQTLDQYGIKLSNGSKIDANEYYNWLMKKSNSYNIIESESVLKVTDMTVINELNDKRKKEESSSYSLPKSRSFLEMTNCKNGKIATYYCGECAPKPDYTHDGKTSACTPCMKGNASGGSKFPNCRSKCEKHSWPLCLYTNSCASVRKDAEKHEQYKIYSSFDRLSQDCCAKSDLRRKKTGLGFGKVCLYFLYCLLLWIPMGVVLYLLYIYLYRDKKSVLGLTEMKEGIARKHFKCDNDTETVKISDLGF